MKYWKYLKYVLCHKWFVLIACSKNGIFWRGVMHDMSKLHPSEFIPYARYFNGDYPSIEEFSGDVRNRYLSAGCYKEKIKEDFDFAWLLHQRRNKHHWQWWILQEDDGGKKIMEMDRISILEMFSDWVGAGKAQGFGDNTYKWYHNNKNKIILSPLGRKWIEELVEDTK